MNSIRTFDFTNTVHVDAENSLIAGDGRIEAAKQVGLASVPTVCLAGMTQQVRFIPPQSRGNRAPCRTVRTRETFSMMANGGLEDGSNEQSRAGN